MTRQCILRHRDCSTDFLFIKGSGQYTTVMQAILLTAVAVVVSWLLLGSEHSQHYKAATRPGHPTKLCQINDRRLCNEFITLPNGGWDLYVAAVHIYYLFFIVCCWGTYSSTSRAGTAQKRMCSA